MRVGLLGGSFDPVHCGHVEAARAARAELALDRVLFLPTARPPHKPERRLVPAWRRYAMVEIALLDEPRLEASDLELGDQPIYTIETLERLAAERPRIEHVLLVGADSLVGFETWRRWREILASTELGVLARPGFDRRKLETALDEPLRAALAHARTTWIESVEHPASASEIRRRLAAGLSIPEGWLDPRVLAFIRKYALYQ